MAMKCFVFARICFVFLGSVIAAQSPFFHRLVGARIDGVWVVQYGVQTLIRCCFVCSHQTDCVVVNYNNDADTCELLTKVAPTEKFNVSSDPAWTIYYSSLTDINVAFGATAWQSSTTNGGVAERAIDGIKLTAYTSNSCTQTAMIPNQWWMIEFGREYLISGVTIWHRSDSCCYARLRNMVVSISKMTEEIDLPSNVCALYPGPSTREVNPVTIQCAKKMEGRYLKVLKNDPRADMNICEIEFY